MKLLKIAFAALVLAGCSSRSSHTLVVEGEPAAVARFVDAESTRPGEVSVTIPKGGRRAEFVLATAGAQEEMMRRAVAANLATVETKSYDWSVGGVAKGSTSTNAHSE